MADAQKPSQSVLIIFKSIAKRFNRKFAQIVFVLANHKRAGSLGALAGFAIAVLFTWKFLRSPARPRIREQQETGSTSTNIGPCQPVESAKDVELVDDFRPPAELSLAQRIKKKLHGSRKVTCQLLGVVLEESSPEELQEHATVRSSVVEILLEISKICEIYLMERILDDESEERVISALENAGLFTAGGLMKDKVLFCSTENGRLSFVRQLEPDWHIDTNPEILTQLARFIRNPLYISPSESGFNSGSNILSSMSLELYFAKENVS
ncbi:peroxisome biogenesis protein 22-like [Diospyros lotus]|uniref:peroxisome biogenesis protein 22-like n=1 Tax=Diospyros lotus TaxID=55363 RepID=UPI00225AC764|nr:peroxisome biogenesis protein 22-like [Diospyros lotus]